MPPNENSSRRPTSLRCYTVTHKFTTVSCVTRSAADSRGPFPTMSIYSEDERLQRKRHAAKLRQRRCREKKRLAMINAASISKTSSTADSNKSTRRGRNKTGSPCTSASPNTTIHPFQQDLPRMMHSIQFPRLSPPQAYATHANDHYVWQQQHRSPYVHAHHPSPCSPYAHPTRLAPRFVDPNHWHQHSVHSATTTPSGPLSESHWSPIVPGDDSIGSSASLSSQRSSPSEHVLDNKEAAAIDAMLSLCKIDGSDAEDTASTASIQSDVSTQPETGSALCESQSRHWSDVVGPSVMCTAVDV